MIKCLENGTNGMTSAEDEMERITRDFFYGLFSTKGVGDLDFILSNVDRSITKDLNEQLTKIYSIEKVVHALKKRGPTKALGIDGFPALFFQRCWHIVGKDIGEFCLRMLNDGRD